MMRRWIVWLVVLAVGGGAIVYGFSGGGGPQYEIVTAATERGPVTMTIETSGTVEPLSTVQVGCEVTGRIVELTADHDDPVKKDQVLARIDPELANAEHAQSEADFLKAQSALEDARVARAELKVNLPVQTQQALGRMQEAEAALVDAEYNWKRVERLYAEENASEAELIARKAAFLRAQSALTTAKAAHQLAVNNETYLLQRAEQTVAQAQAALKLAEARREFTATRVERCTIPSPIDGIVLRRYLDVGTTVTAAFQTPILYLLAPSLDRMRVVAKVSESDISHIEVGQTARFTVAARQSVSFEGKLLHKRNQPETVQNVVTYTVILEVDNDDHRTLMPGLSVIVDIECAAKPEATRLANAVLRFKPPLANDDRQALLNTIQWPAKPETDSAGRPALYCSKGIAWRYAPAQDRWTPVPLWLGITDNTSTEVLTGAEPGDAFVRKCIVRKSEGFNLKEALKLARPDNRTL